MLRLLTEAKSNVEALAKEKQKYSKKQAELAQTKSNLQALETTKNNAEEKLKAKQAENQCKETELANAQKTLLALQADKSQLQKDLNTQQTKNKCNHNEISKNKTEIERLTKKLKEEEETNQKTLDNINKINEHVQAWTKIHKELLALTSNMANAAHAAN
jgi:chromosome segregation ATPase